MPKIFESLEERFGLDTRSLALFRMSLAVLAAWVVVIRWPDLAVFYTDGGVLPLELHRKIGNPLAFSFHAMSGGAPFETVLFAAQFAAAAAFFAGFKTRVSGAVTWLLLVSLQNRNPMVLNYGDIYLRLIFFWALFLPLGARFSLDARGAARPDRTRFSAACAALWLQVCFVYFFTAAYKLGAPEWSHDFTAMESALGLLSLGHPVKPFGRWLAESGFATRALTAAVLVFELLVPVLLLFPGLLARKSWAIVRTGVIFLIIAFHAGIVLCLEIGMFPWVCAAAVLPFLPSAFWERLSARGGSGASEPVKAPAAATQALLAALLVFIVLVNAAPFFKPVQKIGRPFRIEHFFPLGQSWRMFVGLADDDVWPVAEGTLADGTKKDLLTGSPLSRKKPTTLVGLFDSDAWYKYVDKLKYYERPFREPYARYLCSRWNRTESPRLERVDIYLLVQDHRAPDAPIRRLPLVENFTCGEEGLS